MAMQQKAPTSRIDDTLLSQFRAIVGPAHAVVDPDQQMPYLREWRDTYFGVSPLVVRPGSVDEVSQVLALANANRLPVVPQAGNTGLVGGQIPSDANTEIVLSVERLNAVRAVDPAGGTLTVEAGMTLADCQTAADDVDRLFPLSLPSEGSCRIGGNIATNAGGVGVLAYGNARQLVMGLEVVLPDGRVLNDLNTLKKNNTGYDLKNLFIGSEGTLGVITAAVLRLFPKPAEKATAFVAIPRLDSAIDLLGKAQQLAGSNLTAFEFIPRIVLEFVTRHVSGARDPLAEIYPWYALIEISGPKPDGQAEQTMQTLLETAAEAGLILDGVVAGSIAQSRDLWKLREGISEAQKPEGRNIKHDVSVPIAAIPDFVSKVNAAVLNICPGARPLALGHFGDGNVHYNVVQPIDMDPKQFGALGPNISAAVYDVVAQFGGAISAEHGIGQMKTDVLAQTKDPVAFDLMRSIKMLLDPNGIMNPGKVLNNL
ncbi:MAG: FAD-binding oxidoreductase [Pseudomonadota bacterium]